MWLCFLIAVIVGVQCAPAPNFQFGSLSMPSFNPFGAKQPDYGVQFTAHGVELNRHSEKKAHKVDHRQQAYNTSTTNDKDPNHKSVSESDTTKTHDSTEDTKETEDSGLKLTWTGVHLYDDKNKVSDRTSVDSETSKTRDRSMDKCGNKKHLESSGRDVSVSERAREHHEARESTNIDLDGDFTKHLDTFSHVNVADMFDNIGKGDADVLSKTGRGKGGLATKEATTLDTREATKHISENNFNKTRDITKEGNKTHVLTTEQKHNHTITLKESSRNETHEKQVKVIKGDDKNNTVTDKNNQGKNNKEGPYSGQGKNSTGIDKNGAKSKNVTENGTENVNAQGKNTPVKNEAKNGNYVDDTQNGGKDNVTLDALDKLGKKDNMTQDTSSGQDKLQDNNDDKDKLGGKDNETQDLGGQDKLQDNNDKKDTNDDKIKEIKNSTDTEQNNSDGNKTDESKSVIIDKTIEEKKSE